METISHLSESQSGSAGATAFSYESVLNHVDVGIYTVDGRGLCTQINAAALKLLGRSESECLGRDMHSLVHYQHANGTPFPVEECPLYKARCTNEAVHGLDEIMFHKSGEPIHVICSSVPIQAGSGAVGTVVTLNDITAKRHIEDQFLRSEQEHREALRQRDVTARVQQEMAREETDRQRETTASVERAAAQQLREQQRMAEDQLVQSEKLAAVGRLAASISHEINNPLEAVTNLLYLAHHDASLSEEAREYMRLAEEELARVSEIVAQTLRFQRGGAAPKDCTPEALIESVLALYQGRLHNTGIRIDRQHRNSQTFRCSEGDIRQILNNLIGNAIDAMKDCGGSIKVRTAPARDPISGQPGIRISVGDSGHGMSRKTASQIFEPFYTTKGSSGSGLGLWISNSIAKRHGGKLSVRSRTAGGQRGTTFSLFLPHLRIAA